MLSRLTTTFEACFKLASSSVNDQQSNISLSSSENHIWDEITMARSIQQYYCFSVGFKLRLTYIHCDTTRSIERKTTINEIGGYK